MIALLIASTLAPYAGVIELMQLTACVGAVCLANGFQLDANGEPLTDEEAPSTERCPVSPVTIRSGAYLASGLTVQIAA